jgi:hypothetical protein
MTTYFMCVLHSLTQLHLLREAFPMFNRFTTPSNQNYGVWRKKVTWGSSVREEVPYMTMFPAGTWEHAVACTYHDAHNQLGRCAVK